VQVGTAEVGPSADILTAKKGFRSKTRQERRNSNQLGLSCLRVHLLVTQSLAIGFGNDLTQ
jgi:hypothetical protein